LGAGCRTHHTIDRPHSRYPRKRSRGAREGIYVDFQLGGISVRSQHFVARHELDGIGPDELTMVRAALQEQIDAITHIQSAP
jgi:hypothetical protein